MYRVLCMALGYWLVLGFPELGPNPHLNLDPTATPLTPCVRRPNNRISFATFFKLPSLGLGKGVALPDRTLSERSE